MDAPTLHARIHELAGRRQRLWRLQARSWDPERAARIEYLTVLLNGNAWDITGQLGNDAKAGLYGDLRGA